MTTNQLIVGAGHIERLIQEPVALLQEYRQDTGCDYLDYQPITPNDRILPEDLAVTLLVNSRVTWRTFRSIQLHGSTINFDLFPQKPLEETSLDEQRQVAKIIAAMAQWPGFAASVATKVLHKKRPDLIPILDNQAIFGAYMNKDWPDQPARDYSIKNEDWIFRALNWIAFDITRPENASVWPILQSIEPSRTRIQLFDSVWWMYFRLKQPVQQKSIKGVDTADVD